MLSIVAALFLVYTVHSKKIKGRQGEFERIGKYELIHIDAKPFETSQTLEFDAFNQHYVVELTVNSHFHPDRTRHANVDPTTHDKQWFTTRPHSCHYEGEVSNTDGFSLAALSLCPRRGIRGSITAFNETLIIQPSAYFFDHDKDSQSLHDLSDELLVYRSSDFKHGQARAEGVQPDKQEIAASLMKNLKLPADSPKRRRMYSSGNPAEVELTILNCPVRTENYRQNNGGNWYQQLMADYTDIVNKISSKYSKTDWMSAGGVGSYKVVFSEIEIIDSFNVAPYTSLRPNKLFSNCDKGTYEYSDDDMCAIDGNGWLGIFKAWVAANKDWKQYDNVHIVTDMKFKWSGNPPYSVSRTLGWGYVGTMCNKQSSVSVDSVIVDWGLDSAIKTIAHEMGHNFGLSHDTGQYAKSGGSCCAECGIMGYGDEGDKFSDCSREAFAAYFNGNGRGMTCLDEGWDTILKSNYNGQTPQPTPQPNPAPTTPPPPTPQPIQGLTDRPTPAPTPQPTPNPTPYPTPPPVEGGSGCIKLGGTGFSNIDGIWNEIAYKQAGKPVYQKMGQSTYLYYVGDQNVQIGSSSAKWMVGDQIGATTWYAFCALEDIYSCTGSIAVPASQSGYSHTTYSSSTAAACPTCTYDAAYDCLQTVGFPAANSGFWSVAGCWNDHPYYKNNNGQEAYFCYHSQYNRWVLTKELCEVWTSTLIGYANVYTNSQEITANAGWFINQQYSKSVMINDCGGNGKFNTDDLQCLEDSNLGDDLCIYSNETLWSGDQLFAVNTEICQQDRPVFMYTVYGDSELVEVGEEVQDARKVDSIYYLHFNEEESWAVEGEYISQWVISKDRISLDTLAVCTQADLLDCTQGQWEVTVTIDDDGDGLDGMIMTITDKYMDVYQGSCAQKAGVEEDSEGGIGGLWIALIVVVVLLMVAVGGYLVWRKMNQNEQKKIVTTMGANDQTAKKIRVADDEQELEVEVSVERNTMNETERL